MDPCLDWVSHFKESPHEIGFPVGQALGVKLEQTLSHYIACLERSTDMEKLHAGALPWLRLFAVICWTLGLGIRLCQMTVWRDAQGQAEKPRRQRERKTASDPKPLISKSQAGRG